MGLARHPALVELSRDHHHVLVQALYLKRAADRALDDATVRVAREAVAFHGQELVHHAEEEEQVLLPRTEHVDPQGARRIRDEHAEIAARCRGLADALDASQDPRPLMRELGQFLDDHVRFEERSYFEAVQRGLDADSLGALAEAMAGWRAGRPGRACSVRR